MTNTRNTPLEEQEHRYPVRIERLTVRRGSGGRGRRRGGDGIEKVARALVPLVVTFLGERHRAGPPGADGGSAGTPGALAVVGRRGARRLPSKVTLSLATGESIRIHTPGGGGHGRA